MQEVLPQVSKLSGSLMSKTHVDHSFLPEKKYSNQFNKTCFHMSQDVRHVVQKNIRVEIR